MNSGQANSIAIRLILWSLALLAGLFVAAWVGQVLGGFILAYHKIFIALWAVFLIAILYLSRDPDPLEPSDLNAVVAPAHGTVDVIEPATEAEFIKGACQRVSIRVALTDVQVQYAPLTGTVAFFQHQRPLKDGGGAGAASENLFIGLDAIGRAGVKVGLRLIGGTWGRRILPWVRSNDLVTRSVRLGMMRPGSRVDLYLPPDLKLVVKVGDEVAGGQSVVAKFA